MDAQKIKREYTPPMARVIGARMAKGAKPLSMCTNGINPHGTICGPTGSIAGPGANDSCIAGSRAVVGCISGALA